MLAAHALTDYATVAGELGLAGTTDFALLERLIMAASSRIATICNRELHYASVTEARAMYGTAFMVLDRPPLVSVTSVSVDDGVSTLDPSEYSIDNAEAGILYRSAGWPDSGLLRPDLNFSRQVMPGTEQRSCIVTYVGGWVTPVQFAAGQAGGWPGGTVALGRLVVPAAHPTQVWEATTGGAAAGTQPAWPASPIVGQTLADGTVVWTFTGITPVPLARNLPEDLEEAAVLTAKAHYRARRRDPNVKSESLLGASVSYEGSGLPEDAYDIACAYRRVR